MEKSTENSVTPLEPMCCVKSHSGRTKTFQCLLQSVFYLYGIIFFCCIDEQQQQRSHSNNCFIFTGFVKFFYTHIYSSRNVGTEIKVEQAHITKFIVNVV